jgi:hypothetical protein
MTRKQSARLLLLAGLTLALGCRSAPHRQAAPIAPENDVLLSASPIQPGPPLVLNGPPLVLPGEARPFSQAPAEPVLPTPTPTKPPEKIPPAAPMVANNGPALPLNIPPREIAFIPPAVKPTADAPPIIAPIPADVKMPARDAFVSGSKQPVVPFELSIIGPPKDTGAPPTVFPLKAGEKFGHAADYKWVAGVLDRHQKGGYWTIRYADFSEDDRWGGKVRLLDDAKLKDFQSGDVVLLEGELLAPTSAADAAGPFPPYRVTGVKLVQKGR